MEIMGFEELPVKLKGSIETLIRTIGRGDRDGVGSVRDSTAMRRAHVIREFYRIIFSSGFRIQSADAIGLKHCRVWARCKIDTAKRETVRQQFVHIKTALRTMGKEQLLIHLGEGDDVMKPARQGRKTPKQRLVKSLNAIVEANNNLHSKKHKRVGESTKAQRREFYDRFFNDLYTLGFKITRVENLNRKHIQEWLRHKEELGVGASVLQNGASMINTLCQWIGKPQLLGNPRDLLKDPQKFDRTYVTNQDKTDTGKNAFVPWDEMHQKIYQRDPRLAAQYGLMKPFGLRFQEALKARPVKDDRGEFLVVEAGTKGGKYREVQIENDKQREALSLLKPFVVSRNGSTIPREMSYDRWQNHARAINRAVGFTKSECGYTPHSLRHAFANVRYETMTGNKTLVKGGDLKEVELGKDQEARQTISRELGHERISISNCYLGSGPKKK